MTVTLPIIIAEFRRGRDVVRVRLDKYNGVETVDLRVWYSDAAGELRPSPKGLTLGIKHLPALADGIAAALSKASALGLLDDEGARPTGGAPRAGRRRSD